MYGQYSMNHHKRQQCIHLWFWRKIHQQQYGNDINLNRFFENFDKKFI